MRPDEAATLDKAVILGKQGRPKKGEENDVNNIIHPRGSNAANFIARLVRDGLTEELAAIKRRER